MSQFPFTLLYPNLSFETLIIEIMMALPKVQRPGGKIPLQSDLRMRSALEVIPSKEKKKHPFISFSNICGLNSNLDAVPHYVQSSEPLISSSRLWIANILSTILGAIFQVPALSSLNLEKLILSRLRSLTHLRPNLFVVCISRPIIIYSTNTSTLFLKQ